MATGTNELILQELQALRLDFNAFARNTGERVSSLEIQVKQGVTGNGQPSRLSIVEARLDKLSQWKWRMVGAGAGGAAVISVIAWVIEMAWKR